MFDAKEIMGKGLKNGREYLYVGGRRYRLGDCFLLNGIEITVGEIHDQTHFSDGRGQFWHTNMFYDRGCTHCPARNEDKETKGRTPAAIVADNAEAERGTFRENMIQNSPIQVYDSYNRIYFYEKVCWHLVKRGREPSGKESEELLKHGDKLIADLYRHSLLHSDSNVSTKFDIERFLNKYIEQNQLF